MIESLSVVIPVYNSERSLGPLLSQLSEVLPTIASSFEVILINDGSFDGSWDTIIKLKDIYPWLSGVNLRRNYGQHNALLCGIRKANFNAIITMDDDLQHPVEEIHKLLTKLAEGYEVVYGTPHYEQHGIWRVFASQITKFALKNAMGAETARQVSAFRAFNTSLRNAFENYRGSYVSIDVLLTWGTNRFTAIPVEHEPRKYGKSHYTYKKLILHALNMITGFTVLPLQLASLLGFGFSIFGLCILIYVVGRYLIEGGSVAGFPFLASTIAIFSGVQLFALGIIGEYIARIHFGSLGKPSYSIKNEIIANIPWEPNEK